MMLCYQEILLFFSLSGLLRGVLSPCRSPEPCLSKQGTRQQGRRDAGEPSGSGPPPALLLAVSCALLGHADNSGLGQGSQSCPCPGEGANAALLPTPRQQRREQGRHVSWRWLTGHDLIVLGERKKRGRQVRVQGDAGTSLFAAAGGKSSRQNHVS